MIDIDARNVILPHLMDGETLVWADRPHRPDLLAIGSAGFLAFAVIAVWIRAFDAWAEAGLFVRVVAVMIGLLIVVLAFGMARHFWSGQFRTFYGLTDRRGLIVRVRPAVVASIWPGGVDRVERSGGSAIGTIRFLPEGFDNEDSRFRAIRDPATVQQHLSQLLLTQFESFAK